MDELRKLVEKWRDEAEKRESDARADEARRPWYNRADAIRAEVATLNRCSDALAAALSTGGGVILTPEQLQAAYDAVPTTLTSPEHAGESYLTLLCKAINAQLPPPRRRAVASDYWRNNGGVIVDNIAKYAAACHAAGRGQMDDDDAQSEAQIRLTALYASIGRALDAAVAAGRARVLDVIHDALHDAIENMDERDRVRGAVIAALETEWDTAAASGRGTT